MRTVSLTALFSDTDTRKGSPLKWGGCWSRPMLMVTLASLVRGLARWSDTSTVNCNNNHVL